MCICMVADASIYHQCIGMGGRWVSDGVVGVVGMGLDG